MNTYFDNYDAKFPDLVLEIIEYFSLEKRKYINEYKKNNKLGPIFDFIEPYAKPLAGGNGKEYVVQPQVVCRICNKLCDIGLMRKIRNPLSSDEMQDDFMFIKGESQDWKSTDGRKRISHLYNSLVYGFDYIYRIYKNSIFPIVYEKQNGDYTIGTGFQIFGGIATAKHCLEGAKSISIKGYSKEELNAKQIYIHDNSNIDIAFIDVGRKNEFSAYIESAEIMQEVLTMGYPKIPQFTDFLTAELASIASKAESRITTTKGNISAIAETYMGKIELILITAKIRGGNSGCPIVNKNGSVVGIACAIPMFENCGDYDDLGYGVVVPIKYLSEVIAKKTLFSENVNYKDFD